ncbi:hypothetical protein ZIOFF_003010 [Zingiber officinale]|uniref:BED-type domain-containing protein n=1 Tax=Zingiber officinale TaxID=94328 RepID=A0A8J5HXP6_ZINOF|nr:hypothetical protein ZIOFF_003010 [Zingiber officinale]
MLACALRCSPALFVARLSSPSPIVTQRQPVVAQRQPVVAQRQPVVAQRQPVTTQRQPTIASRRCPLSGLPPLLLNCYFQHTESFQNESAQEDVDDYSPLWKFVTKVEKTVGEGNVTWSCNICSKVCKGSYSKVKAHLLKQKGTGIAGEYKDKTFISKLLINAINEVGHQNVVQVVINNAPVCKAAWLLVEVMALAFRDEGDEFGQAQLIRESADQYPSNFSQAAGSYVTHDQLCDAMHDNLLNSTSETTTLRMISNLSLQEKHALKSQSSSRSASV